MTWTEIGGAASFNTPALPNGILRIKLSMYSVGGTKVLYVSVLSNGRLDAVYFSTNPNGITPVFVKMDIIDPAGSLDDDGSGLEFDPNPGNQVRNCFPIFGHFDVSAFKIY